MNRRPASNYVPAAFIGDTLERVAVEHLTDAVFAQILDARERARLCVRADARRRPELEHPYSERPARVPPAARRTSPPTDWLDYAHWAPGGATSLSPEHDGTRVDVDVIHATMPFDGIDVRARDVDFDARRLLHTAAPACRRCRTRAARSSSTCPRARSTSTGARRGWCSPASLSMIHAFHGIDRSVAETARSVFDRAYNGTGNWAFNVAYSGRLGLRGVVAHLSQSRSRAAPRSSAISRSRSPTRGAKANCPARRCRIPAVISPCSAASRAMRDCAINDPAAPNVRVVYPRAAIERIWQRNGGIAYVVAPAGIDVRRRAGMKPAATSAAVVACRRCPELRSYIARVARERKRAHQDCEYWGKPVPAFGDPRRPRADRRARAGSARQQPNRPSVYRRRLRRFLYPALYRAGFASSAATRPTATTACGCTTA